MLRKIFFFIILMTLSPTIMAQDIMDDLSVGDSYESSSEIFTETIKIISSSRKIFILTNENRKLTKGDFISLLLNKELGVRALVAKVDGDQVGIKILKIYSLSLWAKMLPGTEVQILIGDDSYYKKETPQSKEDQKDDLDSIRDEEDLFNDDLDLDQFGDTTDKVRSLKTDNILSAAWGNFPSINADEEDTNHNQFSFAWAHQISDNIYLEGLYGYTKIDNFPSNTGIQTVVSNIAIRGKYNIKLPFYSYIMPFVGIQYLKANSPEAGKSTTDNPLTPAEQQKELDLLERLIPSKTNFTFGATLIRRLVPAWFFKLELELNTRGSIYYAVGVAIEF